MQLKSYFLITFTIFLVFSNYFVPNIFFIKELDPINGQYCSIRTLINEKTYSCGTGNNENYRTIFNWGTLSPPSNK